MESLSICLPIYLPTYLLITIIVIFLFPSYGFFAVVFAQGQTALSITDSMFCLYYPKLLDFMSSLPSMS